MEQPKLPLSHIILRELPTEAISDIIKIILRETKPMVRVSEEDYNEDYHNALIDEMLILWSKFDPDAIAHYIQTEAKKIKIEEVEELYGSSLIGTLKELMGLFMRADLCRLLIDRLGPGEEVRFDITIDSYDDDVVDEMFEAMKEEADEVLRENLGSLPWEADEEESLEDLLGSSGEKTTMFPYKEVPLGNKIWQDKSLRKGCVVEIRGENVQVAITAHREEVILPYGIELLNKVKTAKINKWHEHLPGWEYRVKPI